MRMDSTAECRSKWDIVLQITHKIQYVTVCGYKDTHTCIYIYIYIGSSLLAVTVRRKQSTKSSTRETAKFNHNPPCRAPFVAVSGVALPNCSRPAKARQFNHNTCISCMCSGLCVRAPFWELHWGTSSVQQTAGLIPGVAPPKKTNT